MDYTVKPGESLSGILRAQGNPNWNQPSEWAKINVSSGNPNLIRAGERLTMPQQSQPTQVQAKYTSNSAVSSPGFVSGTPDWIKPMIQKASQDFNVPTAMLSGLLKQESGFRTDAVSPVGAMGVAQFMPETAKAFGINPWNPEQAIHAAAKYIRDEWDYFGKPDLALAAYNAGRGAVERYGGVPPYKETQNYVKNIMAMAGEIHQTANQPLLDIEQQAKKQAQPKVAPARTPQIPQVNFPQPQQPAPSYFTQFSLPERKPTYTDYLG